MWGLLDGKSVLGSSDAKGSKTKASCFHPDIFGEAGLGN